MIVYRISNTVNDRVYIGLTTGPLKKRWREHRCAANINVDKPLYRAMRKHGIDKFTIQEIYRATSLEDLRAAELRFISAEKAHAVDGGYNLTDHGLVHGTIGRKTGEAVYNAKLTEDIVAFIRDPNHWDKNNKQLLGMVVEKFNAVIAKDTLRDARRGDSWAYLNAKHAPVKVNQGARRPPMTPEHKAIAIECLAKYRSVALEKLAESKRGKRGPNAKLSEQTVKDIFYSPLSLLKAAAQYGVSKKMVLLIKQRKAHVYLTKDL